MVVAVVMVVVVAAIVMVVAAMVMSCHVIFSFVHFIALYTLGGMHAFRKPLPYNMYLFNLRIANHILIKIFKNKMVVVMAAVAAV